MILDNILEDWLKRKENWILYKCLYHTKEINDAKELKSDVLLRIWNYRQTYTGNSDDSSIENWVFFIIKYAWFHMCTQKQKYKLIPLEDTKDVNYIETPILSSLQTKKELSNITAILDKNLSKTHSKVAIMTSEGYKHNEIANSLNLSKNYISNLSTEVNKFINTGTKSVKKSKKKNKPIVAYKMDEKFNISEQKEFKNPNEAIEMLKIKKSNFYRALKDESSTANGWHFKKKLNEIETI